MFFVEEDMEVRTNPMRLLDRMGIEYKVHDYSQTGAVSGMEVAEAMDEDPNLACKTLVTVGKSHKNHVFVLAVNRELDLKKAAASVGEKSVEMLHSKQLLSTTGYVHGGCSPMCIKKEMDVTLDSRSAENEMIYVSAGKIGFQLELRTADLIRAADMRTADISRDVQ